MTRVPEVGAVILAAGEGQRLRPLTEDLPKALCPVGNVPLLDRALARVAALGLPTAVNAAYLADRIAAHVGDRAHLSIEPAPLGTSGGVARLRSWIDGRAVLIGNADGYLADPHRSVGKDIAAMLDGWSGETVRLLTKPVDPGATGGFSGRRFAGFSLLPWHRVRELTSEPAELVRTVWRPAEAAGELTVVDYAGTYLDTGTPPDYLAANLDTTRGGVLLHPDAVVTGVVRHAVVGAGAVVRGRVERAVVWPGGVVEADEVLVDAVRYPGGTVPAGPAPAAA